MKYRFVAVALLALLAAPAWAAHGPVGPELYVSDADRRHRDPVAAFDDAGRSLVVWEDIRAGLRARLVNRDGSLLGAERTLAGNDLPGSLPYQGGVVAHKHPAVASLPDGGFLVAWTREEAYVRAAAFIVHQKVLARDVYVQRFDRLGAPAGAAVRVSPGGFVLHSRPRLAVRPDGSALVAWQSEPRSTKSDGGIFARQLQRSGQPAGETFRVSEAGGANPAVAMAPSGAFAVAWEGDDGDSKGVFLRLYGRAGLPDGGSFRVHADVAGLQRRPGLAIAPDGEVLVVWQAQVGNDFRHARIEGQLVGAAGNLVGPRFAVSGGEQPTHIAPSAVTLPGGRFLVSWLEWDDVFPVAVSAVELDGHGNRAGDAFQLNRGPIDAHHRTSLAVSATGEVLSAWEGFHGKGRAVAGRMVREE
jgi:hypothetical protein